MAVTVTATVVPPPRSTVGQVARWAAERCPPGTRVLNVGAGADVSGSLRPLLRRRPYLVGVDPDEALEHCRSLDERHRASLEEFAAEQAASFDVVLSIYVLEHVTDPEAFTAAVWRVLRPGGRWYAVTPNLCHYFGAATWTMSRFGTADRVLHRLKGDELRHEHHFPTVYRLNSIRAVTRCCAAAGFESVELRCYDATDRYAWYLPEPLRWVAPAWSGAAYRLGRPGLMGHLSFCATKPGPGVTGR